MRIRDHHVHVVYSAIRTNPDFRRELEALQRPGLAVRQIAMHRRPCLADMASLYALRRYIHQHGPFDVVHGHSSKAGALARLAALGTGALRLYTPNALVTLDPKLSANERRFYGAMERCLSWMSDAIIAVSPEERNEALALGIASKRLFLILSGVKTPSVRARAEARSALDWEWTRFASVRRPLARQKAPERLLAAFAAAARRVGKLRLLVIGDGELAGEMRIAAADLAIDGRIIWTGEVPSSEFFAAIDIFVLPSRFEGLSYSTMEAWPSAFRCREPTRAGRDPLVAQPIDRRDRHPGRGTWDRRRSGVRYRRTGERRRAPPGNVAGVARKKHGVRSIAHGRGGPRTLWPPPGRCAPSRSAVPSRSRVY